MSRAKKNIILLMTNSLFCMLLLYKKYVLVEEISTYLTVWLVCFPIIFLFHIIKLKTKTSFHVFRDMLLFVLTGGAIGITASSFIKGEIFPFDMVWLLLAIIAAFIHYSPSKKDIYTS